MADWGFHWGFGGAYHQAIAAEQKRRNLASGAYGEPVQPTPTPPVPCSCGSAATRRCGRCQTGYCDEHARLQGNTLLCPYCDAHGATSGNTMEDMLRARLGAPPNGRRWTQKF